MGVATGFTAVRMKKIEDETVVSGHVNQATKELILTTRAGVAIPAGNVEGPQGIQGIQGPQGIQGVSGGTTAQRDALFPVPVGIPAIVALANKLPIWHNATIGRLETYYAVTGSAGLLVPGLPAGSTAGWYPVSWDGRDRQIVLLKESFGWSGGSINWDAGPLTLDSSPEISSQQSVPKAAFAVPGSLSGCVKFTEPGMYDVIWGVFPNASPGTAGYRISSSGTWPGPLEGLRGLFGQANAFNGQTFYESYVYALGIRVPVANLEIRCVGSQTSASSNTSYVKVIQRGRL